MRYLGVDFGLRRIGLAESDGTIAAPLKVIEVSSFKKAIEQITSMAKDFDQVIIGKPEGNMGKKVTKLVNLLKKRNIDIKMWDETLSTHKALQYMIQLGYGKKRRRTTDAHSAALILQDYLDSR